MPVKYPVEFEVEPKKLEKGSHWITLLLKNIGGTKLGKLNVELHSLDSHNLKVLTSSEYIPDLKPSEQEIVPFQVLGNSSTNVYASIHGLKNGSHFYWESPTIFLDIGLRTAKLQSLFVLSRPYSSPKKTLEVEASIKGEMESEGLMLEFWIERPNGDLEEIGRIKTKRIIPDETTRYSVEFTPDKQGLYKVYAYLYENERIIGREIDRVQVKE